MIQRAVRRAYVAEACVAEAALNSPVCALNETCRVTTWSSGRTSTNAAPAREAPCRTLHSPAGTVSALRKEGLDASDTLMQV